MKFLVGGDYTDRGVMVTFTVYKYNQHIFIDGTFYVVPKASYQVMTMRLHEINEDNFYTVGYSILPFFLIQNYPEKISILYYIF